MDECSPFVAIGPRYDLEVVSLLGAVAAKKRGRREKKVKHDQELAPILLYRDIVTS